MKSKLQIRLADYTNGADQRAIKLLLDAYAKDPMGGGKSLGDAILNQVLHDLPTIHGAFTVLAFWDEEPVGLANCFTGYSTFKAKLLINIHDLVVLPEARGLGIGLQLLQTVTDEAIKRGACKLTLEVRDDNRAKNLYLRAGFKKGDPPMEFMTKDL